MRTLTIDHTRVDTYNAIGVLVDGATSDYSPYTLPSAPLVPSGVVNKAILTNDQIIGRNSCQNYNDPTLPPPGVANPTLIDGNCQASGGSTPIPPPLPLVHRSALRPGRRARDRRRVGSRCPATPCRPTSSTERTGRSEASSLRRRTTTRTRSATTPRTTRTCASAPRVRLVGAAASTITRTNITDNAFGVLNTTLDGVDAERGDAGLRARTTGGASAPGR